MRTYTLLLSLVLSVFQGVPWVNPDDVGSQSPNAVVMSYQWGFGIGQGNPAIPLTASDLNVDNWPTQPELGWSNAVTLTMYGGSQGAVMWSDIAIHSFPDSNTKWGTRAFDCWDWEFLRCSFHTIPKEHGTYLNALGHLRWEECYFGGEAEAEWINGQAIQVVYATPESVRAHETGIKDPRIWRRLVDATVRNEWHEVIRCATENVGSPTKSEMASFTFSFFEIEKSGQVGHPVRISGNWMKSHVPWVDPNGVTRDCTGAILVRGRRKAHITGNYIEYVDGDRDVIQLWQVSDGKPGTMDILIQNNMVKAHQNVDIRVLTLEDSIVIRRNAAPLGTRVVISTAPWYIWPPPAATVLVDQPLSEDLYFNWERR